ncbi:hypothetical protein TNCV_3021851 [Trichonephila clavipes]|nr:hypothetical protein TNCV_3021851 [Trichonephila clavipes]
MLCIEQNPIVLKEGRKVRSGYLPFQTNASTLPIMPKRSASRDVSTSSYRYHTTIYSPASVSVNRRTNHTIFVASIDEAHFWLNGYVNKQNCRIWSEANPQVYVETPLHPEKLTFWCALLAGGILLQKR